MKKLTYTILAAMLMVATTLKVSAQSEESRQVSGYNKIGSGGPFEVHVKIDGTESLKIKAEANVIEEIETIVKDGTLQIKFKHHENWGDHNFGPIEIYVTAKSLSALANAGSGSIKLDGNLTGNSINISLSGSGNVSAGVKGGDFRAAISGSGSISVKGSADKTNVSIAGSGDMDGRNFKTETAHVSIAGSGNARFGADKTVSASIVGSGNVVYSGTASISDSRTVGSGRVSHEK